MASNTQSGPISASSPGNSLVNATGTAVTFNTRYPFEKLDSTSSVSFQIINLFFNHEPPNPNPSSGNSGTTNTLVYSFPHGYSYIPATWFLISTNNFTTALGSEGVWLIGNATGAGGSNAQINVTVDATNVNFYIAKFYTNDGISQLPNVIGTFLNIRAYVFVNDLSGNDVPSQA